MSHQRITHAERHLARAEFMRLAIDSARQGISQRQGGPFGACVIRNNEIIAVAHNTVLKDHDATCHAEINAIRQACHAVEHHELRGCVIYSTTEPCPMCFSAIHWAGIERIIYGTSIQDVRKLGFRELSLSNHHMCRHGGANIAIEGRFLRGECQDLLSFWKEQEIKELY